ncbi:hypothetical protein Ddye_027589 [Dipteronia dyeriana]|uniref:Uncharacterized protein n=1 Tax=Dipteronia dyeriana TaxID=168575 RepID=A0AAD9WQB0_9ROSI|nr:hypothetical protein Ddye_027589 [Dipteronia dyeriana]
MASLSPQFLPIRRKLPSIMLLRNLYLSYHNLCSSVSELGMFEVFNDMNGNVEIEGAKPKLHKICCKMKWSKPTYKREKYFKIWLPSCGILLVLLMHYYSR